MDDSMMDYSDDEPQVLRQWSARKMQPIVLVWVAAVFVVFIGLSYFVFHSMTAVKALAMTAVAAIVPLVPSVLNRIEFRVTDRSIDRRPHGLEPPAEFECLVRLDEVSRIAPVSHGFKFYKPLDEPNPVKRLWKTHFSEDFSGEVHVERADREGVFGVLAGVLGQSV
jgi:hypothetical protein